MNAAQFRLLREYIGVPLAWLSQWLDVGERSLARWDNAVSPIPEGVADELSHLVHLTDNSVSDLCEEVAQLPSEGRLLVTYRTDADFHADQPHSEFPASWHRAVVARVLDRVGDCQVTFWSENPEVEPSVRRRDRYSRAPQESL